MRYLFVATLLLFVAGCAGTGKLDYTRPTTQVAPASNFKTVDRSREAVWNASIPELSKQFFVINNLDKSSGLMNISYTGDPERYIDCGRVTSYVKNASGERTYDFAGAKEQQTFEVMYPSVGPFYVDRRLNLEGRVNLIFEETGPTTTRVTANTRYVVTQTIAARRANSIPQTRTDTQSFNSGAGASFSPNSLGQVMECVATGTLEREILSAIK